MKTVWIEYLCNCWSQQLRRYSTRIGSHIMSLVLEIYWLGFWGQKVKVAAGGVITVDGSPSSFI